MWYSERDVTVIDIGKESEALVINDVDCDALKECDHFNNETVGVGEIVGVVAHPLKLASTSAHP